MTVPRIQNRCILNKILALGSILVNMILIVSTIKLEAVDTRHDNTAADTCDDELSYTY